MLFYHVVFLPINLDLTRSVSLARARATSHRLARVPFRFFIVLCSWVTLIRQKHQERKRSERPGQVRWGVRESIKQETRRIERGEERNNRRSNGRAEDRGSIHTSRDTCFFGGFFESPHSRKRTFLEPARSSLIEREISPQTNREVAMRKFPS